MLHTTPAMPDFTSSGSTAAVPIGIGDYYRALFQQLRSGFGGLQESGRALGITSCAVGEGVTTICQNLVVSAAQQLGRPVLLIDANLRNAERSTRGEAARGLYDVLVRGAEPADCIQQAATRDVFVLTAGSRTARGSIPYPKEAFVELLDDLKREFRFIIVDLPVANELTDCFSICGLLDGIVLVVEAERLRSPVVSHVRDQLFQSGAHLFGVVFNKRRNHVPDWLYRRL